MRFCVKKGIDWAVVVASGAIFLAVVYWAYCDLIDGKVIRPVIEMGVRAQNFTHMTTKDTYRPCEMVYAKVLFHKNRNLIGMIQWHLINKNMKEYPPRQGSLPVGVYDKVVRVEEIPPDALPGEHWFCGVVTYHPNWLGIVNVPLWTNKFQVTAKDGKCP